MITTALIGSPVEHSVSPALFKLYADEHGLEYAHSKFDVQAEDLEIVIRSLCSYGFAGVNITLPYKSDVMPFLDEISSEAKAIGAVNTIKVEGKKLIGFNTDAYGALRAIEKASQRPITSDDVAIVFGTGGAARAVVWVLLSRGVSIEVVYREPESQRTKTIKNDFMDRVRFISQSDLVQENFQGKTIICNATSAGMYPRDDDTPCDLTLFDSVDLNNVIVFDAIFNPVITKFQMQAKKRGATLAYGIDMMIYQGIVAFECWTGKKVSDKTVQKATDILMKHN